MNAESWVPSPAARPIWQLASGYASARRRRHPLWMLEAYFDDSGNGDGPVFVLAGFMSTAEKWAAFNDEWQAVLDEDPALKRFKMQHAMTGSGIWRPMRQDVRNIRLDRFHSVVVRHATIGFGCVIYHDAFNEMMKNGLNFRDTAYWIAFMGAIGVTMQYHRERGLRDKVDFVFDDQGRQFDRALQAFLQLRHTEPYVNEFVAGTPRSARDDDVLPLQAADYLVWQIRRNLASRESGEALPRRLAVSDQETKAEDYRDIPIKVDIWDRARLQDARNETLRLWLAALETEDVPDEVREQARRALLARF